MDGTYQFALISEDLEMISRYGVADDVEDYETAYKVTDDGAATGARIGGFGSTGV